MSHFNKHNLNDPNFIHLKGNFHSVPDSAISAPPNFSTKPVYSKHSFWLQTYRDRKQLRPGSVLGLQPSTERSFPKMVSARDKSTSACNYLDQLNYLHRHPLAKVSEASGMRSLIFSLKHLVAHIVSK